MTPTDLLINSLCTPTRTLLTLAAIAVTLGAVGWALRPREARA